MGLIPFKKKKKSTESAQGQNSNDDITPTTTSSQQLRSTSLNSHRANAITPDTDGTKIKPKWSPIRKILSTGKTTATSTNDSKNVHSGESTQPIPTVSVVGKDHIEVMTLESQKKRMDQREAIRKKLFESNNNNNNSYDQNGDNNDDDDEDYDHFSIYGSTLNTPPRSLSMKRSATNASQEILPNGKIQDAMLESPNSKSDRYSLPLHLVSRSWDNGSLQRITEEPVEYGAVKARTVGPISVDLSYTESELASVITKRMDQPSAQQTPITTMMTPNSPESTAYYNSPESSVPNTPDSTTVGERSTIGPTSTTTGVVSPASTARSSVIPIDEHLDELEIQRKLNTGKSPLKGMPEDEQLEYQKDEIESLENDTFSSPFRNFGFDFSKISSSFGFMQTNETSKKTIDNEDTIPTNEPATSNTLNVSGTGEDPQPIDATSNSFIQEEIPIGSIPPSQQSPLSRVPEVGRAIIQKVYECGNGALTNTILTGNNVGNVCAHPAVDISSSRSKASVDATASLTTYTYHRPVYLDEASTLRFLRRITNNGFVLLYLQPPEVDDNDVSDVNNNSIDEWKGRTVTIVIQKGQLALDVTVNNKVTIFDHTIHENKDPSRSPKLEWTTVIGGLTTEATTTSISLLNIQSISVNDDEDIDDEDDLCFFTITSENGDVHVFETATVEERDRIVNGLRTLIARWSYHVIAGDVTATSELFDNTITSSTNPESNLNQSYEDIPSLPNPHLAMNYVAHMLLDNEI
jgi:hypothetical protein